MLSWGDSSELILRCAGDSPYTPCPSPAQCDTTQSFRSSVQSFSRPSVGDGLHFLQVEPFPIYKLCPPECSMPVAHLFVLCSAGVKLHRCLQCPGEMRWGGKKWRLQGPAKPLDVGCWHIWWDSTLYPGSPLKGQCVTGWKHHRSRASPCPATWTMLEKQDILLEEPWFIQRLIACSSD